MGKGVDYHERLLALIASGEVKDKAGLQRKKIELCREFTMDTVPPNSETLARAPPELVPVVLEVLRRKPVRTLSGVAVVAVMPTRRARTQALASARAGTEDCSTGQ